MPKKFQIGSMNGLPELRVTVDTKGIFPVPIVQSRETTIHAFLCVNPPANADHRFWDAVRDCMLMAGAGAFVAGVIPGGMAFMPTFMRFFSTKAVEKGFELVVEQFQLTTETQYGEWR